MLDYDLRKIDRRLVRIRPKERSVLELALGYAQFNSTDEIDKLMTRIQNEIIDYNPFSDF